MRKVNIKYVIIFFTMLCSAAALHLLKEKKQRISTLKSDEAGYAIPDTSLPDKLVIRNGQSAKITLAKKNGVWMVNDSITGDAGIMSRLMLVFAGFKTDRPVAEAVRDSLLKALPVAGANVVVYGAGKELKNYCIGSHTPDYKSNYFMLQGSGEVNAVSLPGYTADLKDIFSTDPMMWKDRTICALNPYGIEEITLIHPSNPGRTFSIVSGQEFFEVKGVSKIDSGAVMTYLSFFAMLKASGYVTEADAVIPQLKKPDFILEIKAKTASKSRTLNIYAAETGSVGNRKTVYVAHSLPEPGYVYLNKQLLARILRSKSDFEAKEKDPTTLF